ncbi:predicted protein [Nematostella vectensis]|uniref:Uncharacterized protein n=1 Tax=Nematostella vectensis TaxID=45351 RepID=A7S3R2_NEMVE|nr:predicted protein [Nematostella vectensis]|eukprot:XP_001633713.1 predicted protein [Nematostella vectensis]
MFLASVWYSFYQKIFIFVSSKTLLPPPLDYAQRYAMLLRIQASPVVYSRFIAALNEYSLSKDAMKLHFKMEGSVNGHCFEIQGVGEGKAFDGEHWSKLCVVKGKHLPFSFDILMPSMSYGTKQFAKYPAGMTDFFKAAVENGGLSWERTMTFEDGGYCTIVNTSELKDGSLHYHTNFHGINLKPDGPVMQKRTMGWLPSVETNIPRRDTLLGDINMLLKVNDGSFLRVQFETVYRFMKPVPAGFKMPPHHFMAYRLTRVDNDEHCDTVIQHEWSEAFSCFLPEKPTMQLPKLK